MKESRKSDTHSHSKGDGCPICELMDSGDAGDPQKLSEAFLKAAKDPNSVVGFGLD